MTPTHTLDAVRLWFIGLAVASGLSGCSAAAGASSSDDYEIAPCTVAEFQQIDGIPAVQIRDSDRVVLTKSDGTDVVTTWAAIREVAAAGRLTNSDVDRVRIPLQPAEVEASAGEACGRGDAPTAATAQAISDLFDVPGSYGTPMRLIPDERAVVTTNGSNLIFTIPVVPGKALPIDFASHVDVAHPEIRDFVLQRPDGLHIDVAAARKRGLQSVTFITYAESRVSRPVFAAIVTDPRAAQELKQAQLTTLPFRDGNATGTSGQEGLSASYGLANAPLQVAIHVVSPVPADQARANAAQQAASSTRSMWRRVFGFVGGQHILDLLRRPAAVQTNKTQVERPPTVLTQTVAQFLLEP